MKIKSICFNCLKKEFNKVGKKIPNGRSIQYAWQKARTSMGATSMNSDFNRLDDLLDAEANIVSVCYPCIYQMTVRDLADLDDERVNLINEYEVKITNIRHAKADLMGVEPKAIDIALAKAENVEYDEYSFFGMFNYKSCGFKKGIVKQSGWAKERVKYLDGLPKQQGLFADEVVIDDKCNSGYCGV